MDWLEYGDYGFSENSLSRDPAVAVMHGEQKSLFLVQSNQSTAAYTLLVSRSVCPNFS